MGHPRAQARLNARRQSAVAGEIWFFLGDERIEASAGDFAFLPKDVPHAFSSSAIVRST
jgi:uncharacterized RmlC-like cupin family protein